jgi:hypothetical protein
LIAASVGLPARLAYADDGDTPGTRPGLPKETRINKITARILTAGAVAVVVSGLTAETAHALPVAVVGSGCRPQSTPTVDPDGVTVYCARIEYTDGHVWSRIADTVPNPTFQEAFHPENICAKQTGWSVGKCSTAIANATYRGDGRDTTE